MNDVNFVKSDAQELSRRRGMATARQARETERASLLLKLIRTERKASQLREWIAQREADGEASSPEIQRLLKWAKAALSEMERFLVPADLARLLQTRNLFPEVDDLADPLGEPLPLRPWGR